MMEPKWPIDILEAFVMLVHRLDLCKWPRMTTVVGAVRKHRDRNDGDVC